MPTKRGRYYYVKRSFRGIGRVYRSLGTSSKTRARALEDMLVTLHDGGRSDVVRAFAEGEVSVQEIAEHHETGRMHELVDRLNAPPEITLAAAIDEALAIKATDVADSTHERYDDGLTHFLRIMGDVSVQAALESSAIHRFKAERIAEGRARETVNNDLIAVGVLVTHALDAGWITERPKVKKFKPQARFSYLDPGQLTMYMASLRPAFRVQMKVLVGTGMRLSECEGLTPGDVKGDRLLIVDAKSGEARTVYMPTWVGTAIREHIDEHALSGADRLFTIKRRTVQDEHSRACKLAGIVGYKLHDHRHTAAVALARAGIPLPVLQRQLGHKSIATTMKYASFNPDYSDVGTYFERVAESYGLVAPGNKVGNTAKTQTESP